jgi:HPt (histidine-containing phosphotransfer) domain-containing protein
MSDLAINHYDSSGNSALEVAALSEAPAIDLVLLARHSLGDQDLERELLALFEAQAARIIGPLAAARSDDFKRRADLAHTLRGSALAVGANRVGAAAARLEALCGDCAGQATAAAALASLAGAVSEAREAIARLLG